MDTNLLKIFLTYSKTQNLRQTGEFHQLSHVGVIRALRRLEDELQLKLTIKSGRGSQLTKEGKKILSQVENLLKEEKKLIYFSEEKNLDNSPYKIATFEVFSTHLSPTLNEQLGLNRAVDYYEKIPGAIESAVKSGAVDVGVTYLPIAFENVEHLKVTTIHMGVFQSANAKFSGLNLNEIPFVIPLREEQSTPTKARGLDGWPDDKFPRNARYRVTLLESALAMVSHSQCIGYFPKFIVDRYNEGRKEAFKLVELSVSSKIEKTQAVYLVKRKNDEESLEMKKIAKVLRTLK